MKKNRLISLYHQTIENQNLSLDQSQIQILSQLQESLDILDDLHQTQESTIDKFKWFVQNKILKKQTALPHIYLYGDVGRGKSFLTNLFFQAIQQPKQQLHFHEFMSEVHGLLHHHRYNSAIKRGNLFSQIATDYKKEFGVLYIDEFQISDIADAMIIEELFYNLLQAGIMILITSNRSPNTLYMGGIQREKFEDFIKFLEKNMQILTLEHDIDYRENDNRTHLYYTSTNKENNYRIDLIFHELRNNEEVIKKSITYQDREIIIPQYSNHIGVFHFSDLCQKYLYATDYNLICKQCDIIIIKNIPKLTKEDRNEAKRFLTLIDEIYQHHCILIISCEVKIEEIYNHGDGKFEFERTISRLKEIDSLPYIQASNVKKDIIAKLLLLI